jgi:hypothetical protein
MGDYGLNNTFEYVELALDSYDATSSGNTYFENSNSPTNQIKFSWPQFSYTTKKQTIAGFKVLSAEIPFVFDIVNIANNTFIFNDGTDHLITVPIGTYTGAQLATELTSLLSAISGGFTVTWNNQTLKFTFQKAASSTWSLSFPTENSMYFLMGFLSGSTNTVTGTTMVSTTVAQVSGPYYLYINSKTLGTFVNFNLTDGSHTRGVGPEVCRVPINVQYGSVIFYNDPDSSKYFDFFAGRQFDNFDFYLTLGHEQYQKPLDMKGASWSIKIGLLIYRSASTDLYLKPSAGTLIR